MKILALLFELSC